MEWISVKDRLPKEIMKPYLVYIEGFSDPDEAIEISWYDGELQIPQYPELEKGITHWMPLPEPPKER